MSGLGGGAGCQVNVSAPLCGSGGGFLAGSDEGDGVSGQFARGYAYIVYVCAMVGKVEV